MLRKSKSEVFLRERLKGFRIKSNLTQSDIAEMSGISFDYYKSIEQGVRPNLSIRVIEQIADAYGLTAYQLLAPDEPTIKLKSKPVPPPHYKKRKKSA